MRSKNKISERIVDLICGNGTADREGVCKAVAQAHTLRRCRKDYQSRNHNLKLEQTQNNDVYAKAEYKSAGKKSISKLEVRKVTKTR